MFFANFFFFSGIAQSHTHTHVALFCFKNRGFTIDWILIFFMASPLVTLMMGNKTNHNLYTHRWISIIALQKRLSIFNPG